MFMTAAPLYQEALNKSGYDFQLKFDPTAAQTSFKKSRKRNISWFNPPYNSTVKTNIGAEFLKLLDKCFPPSHPLRKIINRNTVKLSYSCTPNMEAIISSKNSKILAPPEEEKRSCSCPDKTKCPLDQKCLTNDLIYNAEVTEADGKTRNYTGLASTTFKIRLGIHKQSFKNKDINQTSLSKHIWNLKTKNIDYSLKWNILDRAKTYSPVTKTCALCLKEKYYILFNPTQADLNSRSEFYTNCRHKHAKLLIPKERIRKPG